MSAVRIMTARYAGHCKSCAATITPGDAIAHAGRGVAYCLPCADVRDPRPTARKPRRGEITPTDDAMGRSERSFMVRDPGEDMADRWNESH
jgi:hypothetical protein